MAKVSEIMKKNVVTAPPSMTVFEAVGLMKQMGIGSIVVTADHRELGILTSTDILYKLILEKKNSHETAIGDIMTEPLITTVPETTVEEAAKIMAEHNIKKLPISVNNELVGIVTSSDIIASDPKHLDTLINLVITKQEPMGG